MTGLFSFRDFRSILYTNVKFSMGLDSYLSEPGFSGFLDFRDKSLKHQSAIQIINVKLRIGTLKNQTHNPENLLILKILVQTRINKSNKC